MLVANVRSLEEKESIYNINYQHGATTAAYLLFDNLPGIAPQDVLPRKLKVTAGSQINALSSPPRDWDPSVDFANFKKQARPGFPLHPHRRAGRESCVHSEAGCGHQGCARAAEQVAL